MAKIDIVEPISNMSGTFYYAGFVNGSYISFLGYNILTRKEIKNKLEEIYYDNNRGTERER